MSAAPISAAQAIGEYLQSPDDLLKIAAFRKKLEKEKASIDARLKSGVKEQLDATREGLRKLLSTRNNVQAIKDEMVTVDRECSDPANVVSTFDQISRVSIYTTYRNCYCNIFQVSMVHRNFEQTEEMVNNLLNINSKLDALEDMLVADSEDILGPASNLLPMHFQINQLENFRNQTMHQAKKASADSRNRLTMWFERLNKVIEAFDEYILALARNVLNIARARHPEAIVKLIKIAEIEGKEDERVRKLFFVRYRFISDDRIGCSYQARQKGSHDGCSLQIQIPSSKRTCYQILPLQNHEKHL